MISLTRRVEAEEGEEVDRRTSVHSPRPCDHCGLSTDAIHHQGHVFCCRGCMGAFLLIHEMGLDDYYALRQVAAGQSAVNSESLFIDEASTKAALGVLDDLETAGVEVKRNSDGLCEVRLGVEGLHCAACSWLIERMQPTVEGLRAAQVRFSDRSVRLVYDPQTTNPAKVAQRFSRLGYLLIPRRDDDCVKSSFRQQQQEHWVAIATAAFLAANAMWIGIALYAGESTGMLASHATFLRWLGTLLGVLSAVFPGRIFFRSAIQSLRLGMAHVDIPVAMALGMGTLGSVWGTASGRGHIYFDSLASLVLLLRLGRYIQFRSQYHTSLSLSRLFHWNQGIAQRIESDGTTKRVVTSMLRVDDVVLVEPGETLPADGIVVDGRSHLNVSWLTGESQPRWVEVGAKVIGGTINIDSPIRLRITECGEASRLGQLEEVIRRAAGERTPLVRSADLLGQWFVIVVLGLAVVCWLLWFLASGIEQASLHTVALLTIACPCAIALAAPLVITVAIGRAAKHQIWIRDGECLERLAKPGMMWLDKTGTLTAGELRVDSWEGTTRSLAYAAAVEALVNHPLAKAITDYAKSEKMIESWDVEQLQQRAGMGVSASIDGKRLLVGSERWLRQQQVAIEPVWLEKQEAMIAVGRSPVWVAIDGAVEAIGSIGDYLRADAIRSLNRFQRLGWKLGILSGDRQQVVDYWSRQLAQSGIGLEMARGDCSPEEKAERVRTSIAEGRGQRGPVVFVGDGINDAAALAVADVGIAVRGGTDMGLRAAPVYIANNRLASIEKLIRAAQSSVRSIHRCFAASLIYNAVTIALALSGLIHPLIAAILMPISGLTVLAFAITARTFPSEASL